MFLTVTRWLKWFFGALGYVAVKAALAALLGFPRVVPSPHLYFLELLILCLLPIALCTRYLSHVPDRLETAGLVTLVIAVSFSVAYQSSLPMLSGVAVLGLTQLMHSRRKAHTELELN
jgi:hypothetical protein